MQIKNEKLLSFIKWAIYYFLLLIFYALQTTPRLFELFDIKPVLIIPLVVCVSMHEGVLSSGIYAMIAGLLWDISSDKLFGFNAVILISCAVMISLLCIFYLRTKLINSIGFCFATAIIQGLLDFLFYYALWDYSDVNAIFLKYILPTVIYTVVLTPLFLLIVRFVSRRFNINSRA